MGIVLVTVSLMLISTRSFSSASTEAVQATPQRGSYVIGVDAGTESVRVGIYRVAAASSSLLSSASEPYPAHFPQAGQAEQHPEQWWRALGVACRKALAEVDETVREGIVGLAVDTTACSVVALDREMRPLRPCLLWMDTRAALQCRDILDKARCVV